MAMNFPSSPTVGQTYSVSGGPTYTWDGSVWKVLTPGQQYSPQQFTATAGQTTFTISGGYVIGAIDVFRNGVKLVNGQDFTATDLATVVLIAACSAGDTVEVIKLAQILYSAALKNSNNLSDVSNAATALANLGGVSNTSQLAGNRNKIINGAMMIDQRNAGASVTNIAGGVYTVDRFSFYGSQASKCTIQQNAGSVTPPTGFTNYAGITSSSSYSVLAGDEFVFRQPIEGLNCFDLAFGTASAATVTLSFWVRSSLTGNFGGSLANSALNRAYPFSYTISAANTWEKKTVTITGDTTGTWLTTTGIGLYVTFGLGVGSTYGSGTAGAWTGTYADVPTGSTSVVGTSGATWYVTGVQLEKGATATPFENRLYGTELALCQRYYYLHATGNGKEISLGSYYSATQIEGYIQFPVTMRSAPSGVNVSGTDYYIAYRNGGFDTFNSMQVPTETSTTCAKWFNATEASGTGGNVANVVTNNAAASLAFSAEL